MVTDSGVTTTTAYTGGAVYENGSLKFINHAEGYIEPDGVGGYDYVYQYKDHLGNIRLSYSDSNGDGVVDISELIEESNYYPFGLQHEGYNNTVNGTENKFFTYNGVELEESLDLNMYEMDFRQYDPALGRFTSIDPVTHFEYSTYQAFDNNPVFWADPSGGDSECNTCGTATDMWGRARYDENGMYIPPHERGKGSNSYFIESNSSSQEIDSDGAGYSTDQNQDPCPKCPDKDKRKLAVMMAEQYGGNAQDYYNKLANPDETLANSISENLTNIALFGFLKGGKAKGGIGKNSIKRWLSSLFSNIKIKNIENILKNPNLLKGRSLTEIQKLHGSTKGWMSDVMRRSTTHPNGGWVLKEVTNKGNLTGKRIQYHPGTSRHFGGKPYWKVSDGSIVTRILAGN